MKILFSPSEGKTKLYDCDAFGRDSFLFPDLYEKRVYAVKVYNDYIVNNRAEDIQDIFGIKDIDEIKQYQHNIFEEKTCSAIERYSGVSYYYLAYNTLNETAKEYILDNLIIFSNLFGPVSARDKLPHYKFKQGVKINGFSYEKYYKENFSDALDSYLDNEEIVDLRAGIYEKFYQIKKPYTTYKFIKGGKVVSHFSKAYRGILLKTMAEHNVLSNDELLNNLPETLKMLDKSIKNNKEEITLEVIE